MRGGKGMKIGSDEGNSGALIRFGKHLDHGIWIRRWRFRKLWLKWRFMRDYIDLGVFVIHF